MNHVRGFGKVTTSQPIAGGRLIKEVDEMVEYLEFKFSAKVHPHYLFREIAAKCLEDKRTEDCLKNFRIIEESSRFQVAVFQPEKSMFRTAPYLHLHRVFAKCVWKRSMVLAVYSRNMTWLLVN